MSDILRTLLAIVRPTFAVPALGISLSGGLLASAFSLRVAAVHALAVGIAVLVAHLRDAFVDGHLRGEEQPVASASTLQRGYVAGSVAFLAVVAALWVMAGPVATLLTGPLLALALLHAPVLDRHPLTVTVDYPVGIGLALLGGYAAQTGTLGGAVLAVAVVLAALLAGIKVGVDQLDAEFDRRIGKQTLPVLLGPARARWVAVAIFAGVAVALSGVVVFSSVPVVALGGALAALLCALSVRFDSGLTAVRVQIGLTYAFVAATFAALCRFDCAGWHRLRRVLFYLIESAVV